MKAITRGLENERCPPCVGKEEAKIYTVTFMDEKQGKNIYVINGST
jgi:hypothetical protein